MSIKFLPLTFTDFMISPSKLLSSLEDWRDSGLLAQLFPGFGERSQEDEDEPQREDMKPAARFGDIKLASRDRALLIVLYLALRVSAVKTADKGRTDLPLFERRPWLANIPGITRRDRRKLEYVYGWICARHMGSFPLECIQRCSEHRYGRLAAAYFKAVHYHEIPNEKLDQFLQESWGKSIGVIALGTLLAFAALVMAVVAWLAMSFDSPARHILATVAIATMSIALVIVGLAASYQLDRSPRCNGDEVAIYDS
jgi:hypothetical protein